jgi:hypothetical protein
MARGETNHIPDQSLGINEDHDFEYALCGKQVLLGDMKHWWGIPDQVNCEGCIEKNGGTEWSPDPDWEKLRRIYDEKAKGD